MKISRNNADVVVRQLTEQMQILDEQVIGRIQRSIATIESGVWQGAGSEQFVGELQQSLLQDAIRLRESCQLTINSILRSLEMLDAADTHALTLAKGLDDLVRQITL